MSSLGEREEEQIYYGKDAERYGVYDECNSREEGYCIASGVMGKLWDKILVQMIKEFDQILILS